LNKGIELKERLDSLSLLSKRLGGNVPKNIAQSHRVLIHEGELTKLCRKVPKKRYFFLFNDLLMYGEYSLLSSDGDKAKEIKIAMSFNLLIGHGKMEPIPDSPKAKNAFQILSKEKSFIAWADNPAEKEVWQQKIIEADKSREEIVHVGDKHDSDIFAPTWQNDEEADNCPSCLVKFTKIRRKHHCRKCGSLVCGKCSEHKIEVTGISGGKKRVCEACFKEAGGTIPDKKEKREKTGDKDKEKKEKTESSSNLKLPTKNGEKEKEKKDKTGDKPKKEGKDKKADKKKKSGGD